MNRRRLRGEGVCVVRDEPEERRTPRPQCDDIDERERRVLRFVQEVRTQRHDSAEIMGDHVGRRDLPVREEVGEQLGLRTQVDGVLGVHGRLAVAGHVPEVDGEVAGERLGVRAPQRRRPRCAVAHDQCRPGAELVPGDATSAPLEASGERKVCSHEVDGDRSAGGDVERREDYLVFVEEDVPRR